MGNAIFSFILIIVEVHSARWGDLIEDLVYRDKNLIKKMYLDPLDYIYTSRALFLAPFLAYILLPMLQYSQNISILRGKSLESSLAMLPRSPMVWRVVDLKAMKFKDH